MDYSIGSIADLISGSDTKNKQAVIKKTIKMPSTSEIKTETNDSTHMEDSKVKIQTTKKRKQRQPTTFWNKEAEVSKPVQQMSSEEASKTIFVGNIPITITKKQLKNHFGKHGKVESVRLRCPAPADPKKSKRLTIITKEFNSKRTTLHCYVKYADEESAKKAVAENGTKYKGHFIRVQHCSDNTPPDLKKGIFVGNLPFGAEDDELWKAFEPCGTILSVRIVRDPGSGMGKGFGYVNFSSADAVEFALEMQDVTIRTKVLRIKRLQRNPKRAISSNDIKPKIKAKEKTENPSERKQEVKKSITIKKSLFQGTTAKNIKKKKFKKLSKEAAKKILLSKILTNKKQ